MSVIICQNCGHVVEQATIVERSLDCYRVVQLGALSSRAYASREGISPPYVTLLRRMGIAYVEIGVEPYSTLWTYLAQTPGQYAFRGEVGRAIEAPGATVASVEQAVRQAMIDDGLGALI